jgi:DNA-binding NarL/FixJ family response regulator
LFGWAGSIVSLRFTGFSRQLFPFMANNFVGERANTPEPDKPKLSAATQEILLRLTDGQRVKKIASDLGVTRDAVDGRVRRLYRYFRVKGIAQLVHAAVRGGWITHPAEQPNFAGR